MNRSTTNSTANTITTLTTLICRAALTLWLALILVSNANAQKETGEQIEFWKGTVDDDGTEMEMGLKVFRMADGSLAGKFSSYAQGVVDFPVGFEKDGDSYTVKIPSASFVYSGTLDESKEKISGVIKQGRTKTELVFNKASFVDAPVIEYNRPQNPKAPFPYDSEEVKYENSKQPVTLAGTLTLPRGDGPFPVAITISGSGASDRDESHFGHKPFLVIADHLARRGIAVLRFDDRGRGESTGDHAGATSADFATDVEAGIEFLKQHPKINVNRIGLIGHSEGGLIAPMVAAERDDVHFIVMLAGTGVNGGVILKSQSTAFMKDDGEPEEVLEANRKLHDLILSHIEENSSATRAELKAVSDAFLDSINDKATLKVMKQVAKQLVAIPNSKWISYFVKHEPVETLAKVKCHVLAMNGEKDLQVLCDLNMDPIEKALQEGSPKSFKVVRLPNMNHMFQITDGTGASEDYGKIEETFAPKALRVMSSWLRRVNR